jgi:NADH dehydrogenase
MPSPRCGRVTTRVAVRTGCADETRGDCRRGGAGLNCARRLETHSDVRITLIDKNNYHQFQPLLYQVATGLLSPSNTAFSLRAILQGHTNVDIKMAEVASADLKS